MYANASSVHSRDFSRELADKKLKRHYIYISWWIIEKVVWLVDVCNVVLFINE